MKAHITDAFAAYRELQATRHVLEWLESEFDKTVNPHSAAEKTSIMWAHSIWLGYMRNYTKTLCEFVDPNSGKLAGKLDATDPNWTILTGCKCEGTVWFPEHNTWRGANGRGGAGVDPGGLPAPPAGGCK